MHAPDSGTPAPDSLIGLRRYYSRRCPVRAGQFFVDALGAQEIVLRCADLNVAPKRILDFGSRTGHAAAALRRHYSGVPVVTLECSHELLRCAEEGAEGVAMAVASDAWPAPFASASFDMIVANLSASFWPDGFVGECMRMLCAGGVLLMTCFGPTTLIELRQPGDDAGLGLRQRRLPSVMDVGNLILGHAGRDPVVDSRDYQLEYDSLGALRRDFQLAGISYRAGDDQPAGRIDRLVCRGPVTVEIVTAVAFAPPNPSSHSPIAGDTGIAPS